MSDLIYPFGVLRIFPSLKCNLNCGYCSMRCQPELYKGDEYESEEVDVQKWIDALARIKPTRPDFAVVPCNAEPALYKGCAKIVNSIPQFKTMLYTNCSTESLKEIKQITNRKNLYFYVSYHHGQIDRKEFIENGKWLQENYNVTNFHAPAYPPWKDKLADDKAAMKEAGIELITDHDFLGEYKGEMNYSYLKGGKWIEDRFANRLKGTPKKKVWCKTSQNHASFFTRAYTVAPNGNIYTCWRYLYNHSDKGILGNFFDEDFQFKDEFFECEEYGDCNFCAWHKTIIDCETGDKLDDDVTDACEENSISACMIVKDEGEYLQDCLASIHEWVDEIILVDTGSTDNTIEIAKSFDKVKVYEQPWEDNFSLHRNFSMSKATKEWIFIVDADERVPLEDGIALKRVLSDIEGDIVAGDVLNMYGQPREVKGRFPSLRVFRRSYGPSYLGRVHNKPVVKAGAKVVRVPFRILHYGYDLPQERMDEKFKRMIRMCKKLTEDEPNNPESWYHYARAMKVKDGKFNDAQKDEIVNALQKGIDVAQGKNDDQNVFLQLLGLMAAIRYTIGDTKAASQYAHRALAYKADYLDAIFILALAYTYGSDVLEGERWMKKYLVEQEAYQFSEKMDSITMEHANSRVDAYRVLIEIEKFKATRNAVA